MQARHKSRVKTGEQLHPYLKHCSEHGEPILVLDSLADVAVLGVDVDVMHL